MTLNGVMALILRYFTELRSSRGALRISVRVRCRRKKFTFALSYPGEFLVNLDDVEIRLNSDLVSVRPRDSELTSGYATWFTAAPKPLKYKFLGVTQPPGVAQPLYSRGHN